MKLKIIHSAHAKTVYDILLENGRWLHSQGINQWPLAWLASIKPQIYDSVAAGNFQCTKIDGQIAAVVELLQHPEALWDFDTSPAMYVHKLAVRREHAQIQLGEGILNQVQQDSTTLGLEYLRLDCVASNQRLRNYYASLGFECQGVRQKGEGELALALYQKALG